MKTIMEQLEYRKLPDTEYFNAGIGCAVALLTSLSTPPTPVDLATVECWDTVWLLDKQTKEINEHKCDPVDIKGISEQRWFEDYEVYSSCDECYRAQIAALLAQADALLGEVTE